MNSSTLKGYLTGLILGDGTIDNGVEKRAFRIKSTHQDFLLKIKSDLDKNTNFTTSIKNYESYTGKDLTNHNSYGELTIKAHPYFSKIYHRFYDDFRKRVIDIKAIKDLNWEGWANWFMSDGYIVKVGKESDNIVDRRVELCTDRYKYSDIVHLSGFIQESMGYKIKIVNRGSVYRIRISLIDAQNFLSNIYPHTVESFYYKLDMAYKYRPSWMTDDYYSIMTTIRSASLQ